MEFEFDQAKDAANQAKHGLSLVFETQIFEQLDHIVLSSLRPLDDED